MRCASSCHEPPESLSASSLSPSAHPVSIRDDTAIAMCSVVARNTPTTWTGSETCQCCLSSGSECETHRMAGAMHAHEYQYPRFRKNSSEYGAGFSVKVETK